MTGRPIYTNQPTPRGFIDPLHDGLTIGFRVDGHLVVAQHANHPDWATDVRLINHYGHVRTQVVSNRSVEELATLLSGFGDN